MRISVAAAIVAVVLTHNGTAFSDVRDAYGKLPLGFVRNEGQVHARVRYTARSPRFAAAFTSEEVLLSFGEPKHPTRLALRFIGANRHVRPEGARPLPGTVNYLIGNDPSKWYTNLPSFEEVVYRDLWQGIDLAFSGGRGKLKYEFRIAPGADPRLIRLAYRGASRLALDPSGALVVHTRSGELHDDTPVSFQIIDGRRVPIETGYTLDRRAGGTGFRFTVHGHDRRYPLIIDPGLQYSTFLGGSGSDGRDDRGGGDIAIDDAGHAYVIGNTTSSDFPTTTGALDPTFNGGFLGDVFVAKLNATGSALLYSTFLGGTDSDFGRGIAVDSQGNAYVVGETGSTNFPTSPGAFDVTWNGGNDVFISKLDATGSMLLYSTYLGGTGVERGQGIAIDAFGNAYVTGQAGETFPTTPGAFDATHNSVNDVFVTKLNAAGSALVYSTFLGGSANDFNEGGPIAVDNDGNAYVAGETLSPDFPTTSGAFDQTYNGQGSGSTVFGGDAFLTKLNASGSALVYSTFIGGSSDDAAYGITIDAFGNAYLGGHTNSSNFPTTVGAFDETQNGPPSENSFFGGDAFITKLNAQGSALIYSTFAGGEATDFARDIALDAMGNAYVTGVTQSPDYPTMPSAFDPVSNGSDDVFMTVLNAAGSAVTYSTFLGGFGRDEATGLAVDGAGHAFITGSTDSFNFPTTEGALDQTANGGQDAFVTKLDLEPIPTADLSISKTDSPDPVAAGGTVTYTISINNNGPDPASGVTVVDFLPVQTTFQSVSASPEWTCTSGVTSGFQTITCSSPSLPPGTATITVLAKVKDDAARGPIHNFVNVTAATRDLDTENNQAVATTLVDVAADLALAKSGSPDRVLPDGTLTYTLLVTNHGPSPASAVVVADVLPPEVVAQTAGGEGWSCQVSGGVVECTRASMPIETSAITITARVLPEAPDGTVLLNTATVRSSVFDPVSSNNSATATNTVTANVNQAPVARCRNVELQADAACAAAVTTSDVDNGSTDPDAGDAVALSLSPTGPFGLGAHMVTLTATDDHGASSSCTAVVTVTDMTAPSITAPPAVSVSTGSGATACGAVVSDPALGSASGSDNCPGTTIIRSGVPPNNLFPVGTTVITHTATDAAGNTTSATQTVTVVDTTPPTITCPAGIGAEFTSDAGAAVVYPPATAADNCSSVTASCDVASGSVFPIGTTVVSCTATDAGGNVSSCLFAVLIAGSRGVKQNVLHELIALRATITNRQDGGMLDRAVSELRKSLDPALWVDETHLDPKRGPAAIQAEKNAVVFLQKVAGTHDFIQRIVRADRLLASVAISDAIGRGADASVVKKANDELNRGDRDIAAERYESGIEHYRNAWQHAQK